MYIMPRLWDSRRNRSRWGTQSQATTKRSPSRRARYARRPGSQRHKPGNRRLYPKEQVEQSPPRASRPDEQSTPNVKVNFPLKDTICQTPLKARAYSRSEQQAVDAIRMRHCRIADKESTCSPRLTALAQANNYLAVNLHHLLAEENSNVFFSPFSISTALAILLCAAEGETESELRAALGHAYADIKKSDVADAFEEQMLMLQKDLDSCTLFCANSILTQKGFEVKNQYKSVLADSFRALLLKANISEDTEKTVNEINGWVKEKTNNMIASVVEFLDPKSVMVVINTVYFKGSWLHKFDEASTSIEVFYNKGTENIEREVEMMNMTGNFLFTDNGSFQAVQLPYIDEQLAMLVLLPCSKDGLELLEVSLTPSFVQDIRKTMFKRKVEVSLPKFRLECSKSLLQIFQALGVERVFRQDAEMGFASDSELYLSEIFHKAVLEVNEEGSEATVGTSISVMHNGLSRDPLFYADHPFVFIIYDTRSDLILFIGRVEEF